MSGGRKTTYEYPNAEGVVLFKCVRTDYADGTKKFTQFHRESAAHDWVAKAPPWPRPVWMLSEIDWLPDRSPILVVEGEKTAIAAQALFGSKLTVTTWSGGVSAGGKTDWGPLKRHRVVCWPDLDQHTFPEAHTHAGTVMPFMMQPGTKAMSQVVLATGGALVNIPDAFIEAASWVVPSGWDLADEMPERFDLQYCAELIRQAFGALSVPSVVESSGASMTPDDSEHALNEHHNGMEVAIFEEIFHNHIELLRSTTGAVRAVFENARRLMAQQNKWSLRFDDFSNRPFVNDEPLTNHHLFEMTEAIQSRGVMTSPNTVGEAVMAQAMKIHFHPVRDYLDTLKWDGIERIPMWLIDHAGAADNAYVRAVSAKWLIQAIARIREPGCQADAMLILEGPQGKGKSTLLRTLFGSKYFTDHLPDLSNKDAQLQLLGMWCIEVAELATLGRADANKIKQFLTSRTDRYRPPYGKGAEDFPRSSVFAGTVNPGAQGYLKDPTGGRRFWPVECVGQIDVDAIAANRDQFWAEASAAYERGDAWWITDDSLLAKAKDEQEQRREDDAWEDRISRFLDGKDQTCVADVLTTALNMNNAADWTQMDQNRAARILTTFGWKRAQRRVNGKPKWVYVKE